MPKYQDDQEQSRSRFSSVGRASGSQTFWEHKFESRQPHLCNSTWGQDRLCAGCKEAGKCSTRGGSWGMYITFASAMWIRQPTLALKPRGHVTRNPKQGYQWPQKWHESAKNFKKKERKRTTCNGLLTYVTEPVERKLYKYLLF